MPHPSNPELNDVGEVVAATDWLGNRFAVGDTVIYCVSAGRGQMMAIGKVIKIKTEPRFMFRLPADGVVPEDIKVLVLTAKTSGSWDNKARTRGSWVNPMNITSIAGLAFGAES